MVGRIDAAGFGRFLEGESPADLVSPVNQSVDRFNELVARALRAAEDAVGESGATQGGTTPSGEEARLLEVARALESIFLQALLQGMRRTVPEGGLFPKGFAVETYEGMYDQHLSEVMAKAGGIGLARLIVEQLTSSRGRFDVKA